MNTKFLQFIFAVLVAGLLADCAVTQPPPLPRLDAADQLGWLALIGGPAVLVAAAVFSLTLPGWVTLLAALGFIGGFVSLVVRMDNQPDRFDDPENGAQV